MTPERTIRILRGALDTILAEAKEPIIKVYAQSALDETKDIPVRAVNDVHCKKHKWFGAPPEQCPLCGTHQLKS